MNKDIAVINNSLDYKNAKKNNIKVLDISKWDLTGNDLENLDIKDLGLVVPLDECFYSFHGEKQIYTTGGLGTISPLYSLNDSFVDLRNSNFKGNRVTGSLDNFYDVYRGDTCSFLYNEDTFDKDFIESHKEYFLDDDAPQELKDFYYNPIKVIERDEIEESFIKINQNKDEKVFVEVLRRPKLTFEYYLTNYKYLHNKYLDRFSMSREDKKLIRMVESTGLDNLINNYIDDFKSKENVKEIVKKK